MNRQAFIDRLRLGLSGLPAQAVNEAVADYETHFAEGAAAGRTEDEVAAALGDPARLARELRAEIGLKKWEETRNPTSAAGARRPRPSADRSGSKANGAMPIPRPGRKARPMSCGSRHRAMARR